MENASLARYLDASRILLLKDVSSKKRVFELLGELLAEGLDEVQATQVSTGLQARERLGTTALGEGVAIPHCRIDNIEEIRSAVIKFEDPVDFDAPDEQKVSLFYALLVPDEATDEHLKTLASLAEFLSEQKNRNQLRNCTSAKELLDIFAKTSDKHAA
ncbi:MAG: PTS sugar transporter subunit IIA [Gammaproteobacteria bacterium]|nr:PTS sugar transporter subunit IIA [Gammaproteobacteria bacterium]